MKKQHTTLAITLILSLFLATGCAEDQQDGLLPLLGIAAAGGTAPSDTTAPEMGLVNVFSESDTQISINWDIASDNSTDSADLVYEICISDTSGGCDPFTATQTTTAGTTSATISGLTAGTEYFIVVRALDAAGNSSQPSTEVSILTYAGIADTPVTFVPEGSYTYNVNLGFTTSTPDPSIICFTTNGSDPSCDASGLACTFGDEYISATNTTVASGTIEMITVKAISCKENYIDSSIATTVYTIDLNGPVD